MKITAPKHAVWQDDPEKHTIHPVAYFTREKDAMDFFTAKCTHMKNLVWGDTEAMKEEQEQYAAWRHMATVIDKTRLVTRE